MKPSTTGVWVGLLVLMCGPRVSAEAFSAIEVRLTGHGMIRMSVVIDRYMSDGEATALLDKTTHEGFSSVLNELRRGNKGLVSISGSDPVTVYGAASSPVGTGRRILVICSRQSKGSSSASLAFGIEQPLMAIELEVDAEGKGSGILVESVLVTLDALGFIAIDRYLSTPKLLTEVKRTSYPLQSTRVLELRKDALPAAARIRTRWQESRRRSGSPISR